MKMFFVILFLVAVVGTVIWLVVSGAFRPGNAGRYDLQHVETDPTSPLYGKTIFCLGSSVAKGMASGGVSFLNYLAKSDGCHVIKETVSASTLADRGPISYLKRLHRHTVEEQVDCFLCQLSTNDATFRSELGHISDSFDPTDFDTATTVGGIESVIAYVRRTWDCPIIFFTVPRFDNPRYHMLVNLLMDVAEKWEIGLIDLWHDDDFNNLSPDKTRLYRKDSIHPTKAGYLEWWTPVFRRELIRTLTAVAKGDTTKK